jgi:selenocysteine lyase/cysteine desulfurase
MAGVGRTDATPQADPLGVRAHFPVASDTLYLNSAYIAPTPLAVVEAGRAFAEAKAVRPISLPDMQRHAHGVREKYAALVGAHPDEIAFLYATSEGENIVARGLGLVAGDNVVVDALHYNTTFVLYKELEKRQGIELRVVKAKEGAVTADDFAPHIDARTRIVSVAWVSHQNGFRHDLRPLADLAHARGALLYVDAVQAVGMFPIDVTAAGVDFMSAGTYKWLLAGYGVAPFYVRRELLDRIALDRFGALHVERELGDYRYEIFRTARRFEYATLAFGPIYQLGAAIDYLRSVGVDRIEAHTVALADRLNRGLRDRGLTVVTPLGNRSSIVSFAVDPAWNVGARLTAAGVEVSVREGGRQVRVSPALFTTVEDIDRFLDVAGALGS